MMQLWFEDMIRFMRDASEYGTYNQELAKRLAPELTKQMHICDAGCGLGYLSLALSPHVGKVSAVEKNQEPLKVLAENCERLGIDNISICNGAIQDIVPQQKYDAMVFCFFGKGHEILEVAKQQCSGNVYIITRTYTSHRFSVGDHPTGSFGYRGSRELLRDLGIPYEESAMALEFGQPFRSLEDARTFYEIYSKDEDKSAITDAFLRSKLVETEDPRFPYYMPHLRNLAILKFNAADIPEQINQ